MLDFINDLLTFCKNNPDTVAMGISILLAIVKIFKDKLKFQDSMLLLLNTLKDEKKMEEGKKFTTDTITKLENVANTIQAGKTAVEETKKIINDANGGGLKVGSLHGKPIYLNDVGRVVGLFGRIFR